MKILLLTLNSIGIGCGLFVLVFCNPLLGLVLTAFNGFLFHQNLQRED